MSEHSVLMLEGRQKHLQGAPDALRGCQALACHPGCWSQHVACATELTDTHCELLRLLMGKCRGIGKPARQPTAPCRPQGHR